MAHDTAIEIETTENQDLWNGGQEPFKASYGKLMMWYFLLSDAFTFAGFLIAYGALRFSMNAWPVPDFVFSTTPFGGEGLPLIFVTFMTFVLIVSSVTVLRAVQEGHLENQNGVVKWMVATLIGGGIFLGCQAWEWNNLMNVEGVSIYNNPFSTSLDKGTYISLDEAAKLNPSLERKTMEVNVHEHDGSHKTETVAYLYDATNDVKYFEKVNHHFFHRHAADDATTSKKVDKSFEAGDSYLVTYNEGEYFTAAYKTEIEVDGKTVDVLKAEAMGPRSFGTLFFFITGFHGFHVLSGLVILLIITINTWSGFYRKRNNGHEMVEKVGLYWHFVDLVWVFVFLAFYLI